MRATSKGNDSEGNHQTMSNNWDAVINNLVAVDSATNNTADVVQAGKAFDIVADVEAGANINGFAKGDQLFVSVRNLSQSKTVFQASPSRPLNSIEQPLNDKLRVNVPVGWTGSPGDLMEVVATYRFDAGAYTDYSGTQSRQFIATA